MFGWGSNRHASGPSATLDTLIQAAQQHEQRRITQMHLRFAVDDECRANDDRFLAEVQQAFPHLLPYMQVETPCWQEVSLEIAEGMLMRISINWEEDDWWIQAFGHNRCIPLDATNREDRLLLVLADFRNVYWRDDASHPVAPSR